MIQSTGMKIGLASSADAEQDHALGALHQAALGRQAQALGLGALVGDQVGRGEDRDRQQDQLAVAVRREVVREPPRIKTESATRSTTESKNAPRWLARLEALATGPSKRSWKPVSVSSTTRSRSGPRAIPGRRAGEDQARAVSTSAENPMRTNQRPVGSVVRVSTDFLKFPSSMILRIPCPQL
jgi:hypothetical protein